LLLAGSTIGILVGDSQFFFVSFYLRLLWGSMALISFLLMFYTLFFSLPFTETYIKLNKNNNVVDTGMYSLCRHPGVLWFAFFFLFLWLASGKTIMMWAGIIWTGLNILLVYIEDTIIFPKELIGYNEYKKRVPFILPNYRTIKKTISTLFWRNDTYGEEKSKSISAD
jgi:protein-S-isoprenylcysteine O-methyltransferase Ste14